MLALGLAIAHLCAQLKALDPIKRGLHAIKPTSYLSLVSRTLSERVWLTHIQFTSHKAQKRFT